VSLNCDAVVIGDGLIGLSTAYELARASAAVCLVGAAHEGAASAAAAGLLAPSIGTLSDPVRRIFDASLSRYPQFLSRVQRFDPTLQLQRGLLEVIPDERSAPTKLPSNAVLLDQREVAELEPELSAPFGAVLHRDDSAIDNVRLVRALRMAVSAEATIDRREKTRATRIDVTRQSAAVHLDDGVELAADWVVLAAGAWSPQIAGLPRAVPVSPLKGQMLSLSSSRAALSRPIMGADVYIVPRRDEIVVGATVERAGFDLTVTDNAIDQLRSAAVRLLPSLASAPIRRRWAGTRPATPDMLPIIGADPDVPRLIYACGHSKNGILLAPMTALAIASLVRGLPFEFELEPFAVTRFGNSAQQ
jgi:glycine oxidase